MNPKERLRALLAAAGRAPKQVATLDAPGAPMSGREAMHAMLRACGMIYDFDAEDAFTVDGNHAAALMSIACAAGLDDVSASDQWIPNVGRMLNVRWGVRSAHFLKRLIPLAGGEVSASFGEHPTDDRVSHELLFDALRYVGEPHGLVLVSMRRFDHMMSVGLIPRSLLDAMETNGLVIGTDAYFADAVVTDGHTTDLEPIEAESTEPVALVMDVIRGATTTSITEELAASLPR